MNAGAAFSHKPISYFTQAASSEPDSKWVAIYTRFRREKFVRNLLQKAGIHCYVPLLKKVRKYETKLRYVELPIIHCYVFARILPENRIAVLRTPGVVDFVRFAGEIVTIPEEEIALMQRVVGDIRDEQAFSRDFVSGEEIEVIAGHLTGLRGVLIARKNKAKFQVEFERMGCTLRIDIDPVNMRRTGRRRSFEGRSFCHDVPGTRQGV